MMSTTTKADDEAGNTTGEFIHVRPKPRKVTVEIGAETHPGKVRTNNEDSYLVAKLAKSMRICRTSLSEDWATRFSDEEGYLMVVADGMGGAAAGEKASQLAVETIETFVLNVVKWFLHLESDDALLTGELRRAFERADANVIERARTDLRLQGMGTTLTMAYSVGADLFVVHAGDSRAYLLRDGEFRQITNDHTLVNILVQGGALTPEAARHHARRNVVTNVVGGPSQGVHTEVHRVEVQDGDILLLCSDGLTEPLEDERIAEVLARHQDPEFACRRLIDLSLEAGAPDNVTAVVARYGVR
jgi:serine/threonine protein phosphatase PrpC